jgi:hypothetical protein
MLIITFHNDSTGKDNVGNYNVEVRITTTPTSTARLWKGRVEGHDRSDGWQGLVQRLAWLTKLEGVEDREPAPLSPDGRYI